MYGLDHPVYPHIWFPHTNFLGTSVWFQVVGLARRADRLEEISRELSNLKGELIPVPTDITKEEEILQAFEWTNKHLGPVCILINNAGLGRDSSILNSTTEMWTEIFEVNVIGLCIATREAVKNMRENNIDGHVININSVLGHYCYDLPTANVYPASKHAVTALTECLRMELSSLGTKIKITVRNHVSYFLSSKVIYY